MILVTGANGHIGANVVRELLSRNLPFKAMVREGADLRGLEGLTLDFVYGDVRDADAVSAAAEGCDAIIHLAAVYSVGEKDADKIIRPAVESAKHIFNAAKRHGISRVVYTSSVASIGSSDDPTRLLTADDWNECPNDPYIVAKTRSEQLAQKLAAELGIHMVVICPSMVLGAHDYRITPSNAYIRDWAKGKNPTFKAGFNLVDVRDVAKAHVDALTIGDPGERFIIGGENILLKDLGALLKTLNGRKPMHIPLPRPAMIAIGGAADVLAHIPGVKMPITKQLAKDTIGLYSFFDVSKSVEKLGLQVRLAHEVVDNTLAWLRSIGELPPAK